MKLAITGGLGFIGKHLLWSLCSNSTIRYEITVFTLKLSEEDRIWIKSLALDPNIIEGDISDIDLETNLRNIDVLIHLAWASNPTLTGEDVELERKLNWQPNQKVINACLNCRTKLIFISSGGTIYGEARYLPIDENHQKNPISAYGKAKLEIEEEIVSRLAHNSIILRPSNVYGPVIDKGIPYGVIGFWLSQLKSGNWITIMGEGSITRDYLHVQDLTNAIIKSFNLQAGIFNVGTGIGTSLLQLVEIFEKSISRKIEVSKSEKRSFDVKSNILNASKFNAATGWHPEFNLNQTIQEMIDSYNKL